MLSTKLFTYITSSLLINTLIVELLPPVYATATEPIELRNTIHKVARNSNQGEVIPSLFNSKGSDLTTTSTITGIGQRFLIHAFESKLIENDVEVLNSTELDLDSILAHEFDQKGMIIARCCL